MWGVWLNSPPSFPLLCLQTSSAHKSPSPLPTNLLCPQISQVVTPFEVSFLTTKRDAIFYVNRMVDGYVVWCGVEWCGV